MSKKYFTYKSMLKIKKFVQTGNFTTNCYTVYANVSNYCYRGITSQLILIIVSFVSIVFVKLTKILFLFYL